MGPSGIPPEVQRDLGQMFPGLSVEEALQHQEGLYQSLKTVKQTARFSHNEPSSSLGHSRGVSSVSGRGGYDLDLDEALARSLQELDMDNVPEDVFYSKAVQTTPGNTRHAAESPPISATNENENEINPDQMTYEDLQSLEESVGSESKGLAESQISRLPSRIYKTGYGGFLSKLLRSSKKADIGDCTICCSEYQNNQYVTTLPCAHQYHTECINKWLSETKSTCPVCNKDLKEVI